MARSAVGAQVATGYGVADGLFSWAAWPYGPENMVRRGSVFFSRDDL
jgi:hypothetical protein